MTILAWCLIGAGCILLLYGFEILSVSERSETDTTEGKESERAAKEREGAIQQAFAKYRAKKAALHQEAIRQDFHQTCYRL